MNVYITVDFRVQLGFKVNKLTLEIWCQLAGTINCFKPDPKVKKIEIKSTKGEFSIKLADKL